MKRWLVSALLGASVALGACSSVVPPQLLTAPDFELTGYWAKQELLEGSSLLLSRPLNDRYPVRFSYAGCIRSEIRQLAAHFQAGYLVLSEPVSEYSGPEYSRLALFMFRGKLLLVPEPDIAAFRSASSAHGAEHLEPEYFGYARLSAIP